MRSRSRPISGPALPPPTRGPRREWLRGSRSTRPGAGCSGGGGGTASYGDIYSDVWALSLDHAPAWVNLVPDATRAPIRGGASDGYDASRRRMVVFGGSDELGGF